MVTLIIICLIATELLIWFRTEAWVEYTRLLRLNFLSDYKGFDAAFHEDVSLTYLMYLRRNHDCFLVRLITCPICVAVWLGIFFAICTWWLMFPIYIIGGLLLYTIIDRLLG